MALVVGNVQKLQGESGFDVVKATVTLDTSYPTGGSPGLAGLLGFKTAPVFAVVPLHSKGVIVEYLSTDKLKCYSTLGSETANATNLSGTQIDVLAIGR